MPDHDSPTSTYPSEIEALIARLEDGQLHAEDRRLIGRLLRLLLTLIRVVEQKNTSISRLKRLLFGTGTDNRTNASPAAPSRTSSNDTPSVAADSTPPIADAESQVTQEVQRGRRHGRHGAARYTGAHRVVCADPDLMVGDGCPHALCRGHLYDTREPSLFIRLEGRPIVSATR